MFAVTGLTSTVGVACANAAGAKSPEIAAAIAVFCSVFMGILLFEVKKGDF
jgi:hypothetical protein